MKNNIKTFPYAQKAEQMEAWIRNFERELRELLKDVDFLETEELADKIKEILGEK